MSHVARGLAVIVYFGASIASVQAGDNGHPGLNAIGRFWGVGYSQRGYQVAPGRLNIVRQMHPASDYMSTNLMAPYHQTSNPQAFSYQAPTLVHPASPTSSIVEEKAEVVAPPKPAGPPPPWLQPYLNSESTEMPKASNQPITLENDDVLPVKDVSPSDKAADDLLLNFNSATRRYPPTGKLNRYR
jgi:hypothetical protein